MRIRLIALVGPNGQLDNPWRYPEYVKSFRYYTNGGVVVVGHRTNRSLPVMVNRTVCVMDREETPREIMSRYQGRTIWVAGGAATFKVWMPYIEQFVITPNPVPDGDLTLPPLWRRRRAGDIR